MPLLIGFENPKSDNPRFLAFSKRSNLFGMPKIIFKVEKSLEIENISGATIIEKSNIPESFCNFDILFIAKRRCGCTKIVIKNAKTI